jgi:hypothetical protein
MIATSDRGAAPSLPGRAPCDDSILAVHAHAFAGRTVTVYPAVMIVALDPFRILLPLGAGSGRATVARTDCCPLRGLPLRGLALETRPTPRRAPTRPGERCPYWRHTRGAAPSRASVSWRRASGRAYLPSAPSPRTEVSRSARTLMPLRGRAHREGRELSPCPSSSVLRLPPSPSSLPSHFLHTGRAFSHSGLHGEFPCGRCCLLRSRGPLRSSALPCSSRRAASAAQRRALAASSPRLPRSPSTCQLL